MIHIASLTLAASLLTSSYGFFGNLGASATGVPPLVLNRANPCSLNPHQRLRAWVHYVRAGHIRYAPAGAVTAALHLLTSYSATEPQIRLITLAAGLVGLTLGPYTFTFLAHINAEVDALDAQDGLKDRDADSAEAKRCMQLMDEWRFWHRVREGIFGTVWALGVWAILSEKQL